MPKTKQQIRVLLADDHAIFRDGLRKLLDADEDITIVGEAQNGAECIKMLAKLKPDILLLDLRMPDKVAWLCWRKSTLTRCPPASSF